MLKYPDVYPTHPLIEGPAPTSYGAAVEAEPNLSAAAAVLADVPPLDEFIEAALRDVVAWYGRPFLTIEQFAAVVGCSYNGVWRWISEGSLPYAQIAGRKVIPTQGFLRWLEKRTIYPGAPNPAPGARTVVRRGRPRRR